MKNKLRIFWTNWVNVAGIFLVVYLSAIISELLKIESGTDIIDALGVGILGGLIGILLYGSIFWIGFLLAMFLLDLLLMNEDHKHLRLKLLIEWIAVSSPFLYWFFIYTQWIFAVVIVAFLITQLIREREIKKLILA